MSDQDYDRRARAEDAAQQPPASDRAACPEAPPELVEGLVEGAKLAAIRSRAAWKLDGYDLDKRPAVYIFATDLQQLIQAVQDRRVLLARLDAVEADVAALIDERALLLQIARRASITERRLDYLLDENLSINLSAYRADYGEPEERSDMLAPGGYPRKDHPGAALLARLDAAEADARTPIDAQQDIDTYTRLDYAIGLLESAAPVSIAMRKDIALLLRRWRKARYGSALTDAERAAGRAEINP